MEDVLEVKIREEPAHILDKSAKPEKTALARMGVDELQRRLVRGQMWANEEFMRLESNVMEEKDISVVGDLDSENRFLEEVLSQSEVMVRKAEVSALNLENEEEEIFLQTRTISLNEVRRTLPLWVPPLKEEIQNFDSNQAIQRVTEKVANEMVIEAEQKGQRAEIIPGMGVFTRKAGDGRRRARVVCCGNYMEARTGDEIYASGADSTQLRATLRVASMNAWHCLSLDVKSAFLLAPKAQGELVIVKPPRILVEASLAEPDEHWVVTSAMYGLVTSPKDWSVYRDMELQKMIGEVEKPGLGEKVKTTFGFRPLKDANLWAIQECSSSSVSSTREWGEVLGYMIVYVDDVLMVGSKEVTDSASSTIQNVWKTSSPEYAVPGGAPMRFLGIEIQRLKDGTYYLHQGCYVREVLERHGGGASAPFIKMPDEKEEKGPSLQEIKAAQKITGELLWLSGKTRPDIAWAVMRMSQWAVKRPVWTMELGEAILAYVRSTLDFGLHYPVGVPEDADPDLARLRPRQTGTVELLVDASFSPGDSHSVSGTMVLLAGCPIQWESRKQSLMALSTAEAELTAIVEGLQTGRSVRALVELLVKEVNLEVYNDNRAALILAAGTGGGWRTRRLRIRASCLAEAVKVGEISLNYRMGSSLWADALTKSLPAQSLDKFCRGVHLFHETVVVKEEASGLLAGEQVKLTKCMSVLLAGASLIPGAGASEVCEKGEQEPKSDASLFGDLGWLITLAGLVCLLHFVKEWGFEAVKRLLSGRENMKVKLLTEEAQMPTKGSEEAAGWDISTTSQFVLGPGERKLVSTGIAIDIPKGFYGRIAARSSLALQGIDVAGGVVDSDYRGEVKVILSNASSQEKTFEVGDRVAQMVIEKICTSPWKVSSSLSRSSRGDLGFGSSGVAVRSLSGVVGGLYGRGQGSHDRDRGLLFADRDLHARGDPGHEGDLFSRVPQVHEGVGERQEVGGDLPTSILLDGVYTSRGGESMPDFLERLMENELRSLSWLFCRGVLNILGTKPSNGLTHDYVLRFQHGVVHLKIHRHGGWRKKLFDSDLSVPLTPTGVAAGVITVGWLDDGRMFVRSDNRKGSHGMSYLKQRWFGYSILARATECVGGEAEGSYGSC